jgi:hypothetical protein
LKSNFFLVNPGTNQKTSEKMKQVNRYSISVESGINSGYRNYSRNREMSSSNRSIAFGRTCVGINFVANRKSYFDISYEYQPIRFNTSTSLPAHRNFFQRNSLDGRPRWNSSTHTGNRDTVYFSPERLKSISNKSPLLAKEKRLESPRPIRSTYLGYTNAGNVSGAGSEFFGRPPAGLPNPKSNNNSVANCLNWDLMAPAKLDIQQRTLNATLHQVSQI